MPRVFACYIKGCSRKHGTGRGNFAVKKQIGVAPENIQNQLAILLGDVRYWLAHQTYSAEEIVARFHHRLVWIHPFPNGNGRFSRLAADLFMKQIADTVFSWGQEHLGRMGEKRAAYIRALKQADRHEQFGPLITFMKS